MKKRFVVIPAVAIVIAIIIGIVVPVFTTSLVYNLYKKNEKSNTQNISKKDTSITWESDYFALAEKYGKLMQTVCRFNPSTENIENAAEIYSPTAYIRGTYKKQNPPKDYLENCVLFSKLKYSTEYVDGESSFDNKNTSPVSKLAKKNYLFYNALDYAEALFLNGQIEESKQVIEKLIESVDPEDYYVEPYYTSYINFVFILRDYFYLVFSSTEDEAVKQWVVDKETQVETIADNHKPSKAFIQSYRAKYGGIYFNPSYDSFFLQDWRKTYDLGNISINARTDSNTADTKVENDSELSYDEYFSKIRPYEIIPLNVDETRYILGDTVWIKHSGEYERSAELMGVTNTKTRKNSLYLEDRSRLYSHQTVKTKDFATQLDGTVFWDDAENYYSMPLYCTDQGVYVVVNRTDLVLLNSSGWTVKTVCKMEKNIDLFTVRETVAWVLSGGTIYRIYLPTGNVDKIVDGVDSSTFLCFYYPISNFEIQWLEMTSEYKTMHYYNAKTGESKEKTTALKELSEYNSINEIPTSKNDCRKTGWWFVPDDAYDKLRSVKYTLPDFINDFGYNNLILNDMFHGQITDDVLRKHDIDVYFSCGGAIRLYPKNSPDISLDTSSPIGWISINYDFKPVFKKNKYGVRVLDSIEGLPSYYNLKEFKPLDGYNNIVVAEGEHLIYGQKGVSGVSFNDGIYCRYLPYRFGFICNGDNEPVYCFMLRSDVSAFTEEVFLAMLGSIKVPE